MTDTLLIGDEIRVIVRRSARATRMTLRVPRLGGDPVLTMPRRTPIGEGLAFAESKVDWLRKAASGQTPPATIGNGTIIPIEGRNAVVTPANIRKPMIDQEKLLIPASRPSGAVVQAFLKHLAHQRLSTACQFYTAKLGRNYKTISLRDTKSRWGSCSTEGRLMFSWRLIMAPPEVLDYVSAHEVAHLEYMDHSPKFWTTVEKLMPEYHKHRGWLRQNGNALLAWKFTS